MPSLRAPFRLLVLLVASGLAVSCQGPLEQSSVKPGLVLEADDSWVGESGGISDGVVMDHVVADHEARDIAVMTDALEPAPPAPRAGRELAAAGPGKGGGAPEPPATARMLVQRGEIAIEVARAEDAARAFLAQVAEWGGYLQSQQGSRYVVRLPVARFDDAFAALRGLGRVLREARAADDVTEEYVDLGIRLDNARKARERLLEVLAKAEKVEDILKVEVELRRLTEEIERMEGRRKFLADQVAMATLAAQFETASAPPSPPKRRHRSRFGWIQRVGAESMMGGF
jgi:hypothetical protein